MASAKCHIQNLFTTLRRTCLKQTFDVSSPFKDSLEKKAVVVTKNFQKQEKSPIQNFNYPLTLI